jgi:cytochrome d ubiquinol oxidase subunit II
MLAEATALLMLAALVVYATTAGADFGGGVWDLLATGPRAAAQRKLIENALAPVWETNHVWLIFVVVVLFTCFPDAYAVAGIALHIPLALLLLGIVLRGSAFVFRHYGSAGDVAEHRWGRVFAVGVTVGAITSGTIRVVDGLPTIGFVAGWFGVFPTCVGILTVVLFAFLAAVYLTLEATDDGLREDFRRRALVTGVALAPAALVTVLLMGGEASAFRHAFMNSPWTWPLQIGTAAVAIGCLVALHRRAYRLARALAALQVSLILVGWGLAQRPYLIAPDVTIASAAAPAVTLELTLIIIGGGSLLLVPSLIYLFRVFKK